MQIQGKQRCQGSKPASFQSEGLGWSWKYIFRKLGCVRVHHDKSAFSYQAQRTAWRHEREKERFAFLSFLGKQKHPNLLPECLGSDVYSGLGSTNTGNLKSESTLHSLTSAMLFANVVKVQLLCLNYKWNGEMWTEDKGWRAQILCKASSEIAWRAPAGRRQWPASVFICSACAVKVQLSPQTPQRHNTAGPMIHMIHCFSRHSLLGISLHLLTFFLRWCNHSKLLGSINVSLIINISLIILFYTIKTEYLFSFQEFNKSC